MAGGAEVRMTCVRRSRNHVHRPCLACLRTAQQAAMGQVLARVHVGVPAARVTPGALVVDMSFPVGYIATQGQVVCCWLRRSCRCW